MKDYEVIAELAKENAKLKRQVNELIGSIECAKLVLYCIGGPLNDNKLQYTIDQLMEWRRLANELEA